MKSTTYSEKVLDHFRNPTFGCGSAVATSSMITELARGKTLGEVMKITRDDVARELEGLPPIKMHCLNLAADALHDAIKKYREETSEKGEEETRPKAEIANLEKFREKGVFHLVEDTSRFKDRRVLVADTGPESVNLALKSSRVTPRVALITEKQRATEGANLRKKLRRSDVKVLYESEILEILSEDEVEKVVIYDKDEKENCELFVDAVIIPEKK